MTTTPKTETAAKKDVLKLQRSIVDGLEDVKAQDIRVFNTEHLSPLFERVIIASGTSNRQTKALAMSVRDAVREAGFDKPRMEGEDNGEWIIVDCGACVAHIMQPAIRTYYHLEELWGDTPVSLKGPSGKSADAAKVAKQALADALEAQPKVRRAAAKKAAGEPGSAKEAAVAGPTKGPTRSSNKAPAKKAAPEKTTFAAAKKAAIKAVTAKTAAAKTAPAKTPATKTRVKTVVVGAPARKTAAKTAAAAKTPARKAPARKTAR